MCSKRPRNRRALCYGIFEQRVQNSSETAAAKETGGNLAYSYGSLDSDNTSASAATHIPGANNETAHRKPHLFWLIFFWRIVDHFGFHYDERFLYKLKPQALWISTCRRYSPVFQFFRLENLDGKPDFGILLIGMAHFKNSKYSIV